MPPKIVPTRKKELDPPKGWEWAERVRLTQDGMRGTLTVSDRQNVGLDRMGRRVKNLVAWIKENNNLLYLQAAGANNIATQRIPGGSARVIQNYYVYPDQPTDPNLFSMAKLTPCVCGHAYEMGDIRCKCGRYLACATCRKMFVPLNFSEEANKFYCRSHTSACRNEVQVNGRYRYCGKIIPPGYRYCAECGDRKQCRACNETFEIINRDGIAVVRGRAVAQPLEGLRAEYCSNCRARVCVECDEFSEEGLFYSESLDFEVCRACRDHYAGSSREETFDKEEIPFEKMLLTPDKHRPIRISSIELECAAPGGHLLAAELYKAKLSPYQERQRHSFGGHQNQFCHVEHDSSLGQDGGELIFNRIKLDNKDEVQKLHQAIQLVRKQLSRKELKMDMRCGLHIHVDAHGFGIGHVRNLVLLFNYLEDPLYRLAASRYARHRGMGYASKIEKGPYADKREFANSFFNRNGHASALNVSNYWHSQGNCGCGVAVTGEHEKCTCNLGKCTFEFRIWNGSANFRKIAAYSAISQSLVSFARGFEELNHADYPVLEYNARRKVDADMKQGWYTRLEWMFKNLYFSEAERENIHYTIRHSQLKELDIAKLAQLERVGYRIPPGIEAQGASTVAARKAKANTATETIREAAAREIRFMENVNIQAAPRRANNFWANAPDGVVPPAPFNPDFVIERDEEF